MLMPPLDVATAKSVTALPRGRNLRFEAKADGHRMLLFRTEDRVLCQARSGRIVTEHFPDLVAAAMKLEPGTVLDGEAVVVRDGVMDFGAIQARAASTPARARRLAARFPAIYLAFDVLAHRGDVRALPWDDRHQLLVDLLEPLAPSAIQRVPMTVDPDEALVWMESMLPLGAEGLVVKAGTAPYRAGPIWWKLRHAETVEAAILGVRGPQSRPRALALLLPGSDRARTSTPLSPALRVQAGTALPAGAGAVEADGETFRRVDTDVRAEVRVGSGRHGILTVTRLRYPTD